MNLFIFGLIIIFINFIISLLLVNHLGKAIIENMEVDDKLDKIFAEHICNIYDILIFNNLKRPKKEKEK